MRIRLPEAGPQSGSLKNFFTTTAMATYGQISAWEKLEMLFGKTPRWRRRTSRRYFNGLDAHDAVHHLLMLLGDFLGIKVPACCDFHVREQLATERRLESVKSALPDLSLIEIPQTEEPAAVPQSDLLAAVSR